ncbi:hypothetical protein QP162_19945 [Sphingomonas aurantiaca]
MARCEATTAAIGADVTFNALGIIASSASTTFNGWIDALRRSASTTNRP